MSSMVKWIAIGGGVLFLFKDSLSTLFGGTAAGTEQPAAVIPPATQQPQQPAYQTPQQPAYQAPVYQQPPAYNPPPAYQQPAPGPAAVNVLPVTEDLIKKASYDWDTAQILGTRKLLSVWEWNYYREVSGKSFGSEDFSEYGDPAAKISALEYLNRARAKGLAGIRPAKWRYKHTGNN